MSKVVKTLILASLLGIAAWAIFNNTDKKVSVPPVSENANNQQATKEEIAMVEKPAISILPERVIQGEPAVIVVNGLATSTVESISFNGKRLGTFLYDSKPAAVVGIDLKGKIGAYPIKVALNNGRVVEGILDAGERVMVKTSFDIPENLGGNTPEAERVE